MGWIRLSMSWIWRKIFLLILCWFVKKKWSRKKAVEWLARTELWKIQWIKIMQWKPMWLRLWYEEQGVLASSNTFKYKIMSQANEQVRELWCILYILSFSWILLFLSIWCVSFNVIWPYIYISFTVFNPWITRVLT